MLGIGLPIKRGGNIAFANRRRKEAKMDIAMFWEAFIEILELVFAPEAVVGSVMVFCVAFAAIILAKYRIWPFENSSSDEDELDENEE